MGIFVGKDGKIGNEISTFGKIKVFHYSTQYNLLYYNDKKEG